MVPQLLCLLSRGREGWESFAPESRDRALAHVFVVDPSYLASLGRGRGLGRRPSQEFCPGPTVGIRNPAISPVTASVQREIPGRVGYIRPGDSV